MPVTEIMLVLTCGRPKDLAVRAAVLDVVRENRALNVESIRRLVSQRMGREVNWRTVNRHLNDLEAQQLVKRHILGRFRRSTTMMITGPSITLA